MENQILKSLPLIFLSLLCLVNIACRNGEFEQQNLFQLTENATAQISDLELMDCSENGLVCKNFTIHVSANDSKGNPIQLAANETIWNSAFITNLRFENQTVYQVTINGTFKTNAETSQTVFNTMMTLKTNRGRQLNFEILIDIESPLFITDITPVGSAKTEPAVSNSMEINVSNAESFISSNEQINSQQSRYQVATNLKFVTTSGKPLAHKTIKFSVLYPETKIFEAKTNSAGDAEVSVPIIYNQYDHESVSQVFIRIEFLKTVDSRSFLLRLAFDLEKSGFSPLVNYEFAEEKPDQQIDLKKSNTQTPLEISPQSLSILPIQSQSPNSAPSYLFSAQLNISRNTLKGIQEKNLRHISIRYNLYQVFLEPTEIKVLGKYKNQSATDQDGKISFDFSLNEKTDEKSPNSEKKNIFWIIRFEIPEIPKAERAYFLYSPTTGTYNRYFKEKLPLEFTE